MANAHLKWSIFYAGLSGSEVQIKHPANRRGEGLMMPETIERRILPYLANGDTATHCDQDILFCQAIGRKYHNIRREINIRADKSREDPAEFTYYVSEDGVVFEIDRNMKIQIPA